MSVRTVASALVVEVYERGKREGFGAGLIVGILTALIAYPFWIEAVSWLRLAGVLP